MNFIIYTELTLRFSRDSPPYWRGGSADRNVSSVFAERTISVIYDKKSQNHGCTLEKNVIVSFRGKQMCLYGVLFAVIIGKG